MTRHSALLVVILAAAGCSRAEPEYKEERSPFQLMVEGIGYEPPCSSIIPMEWSPGYPIPALVNGKLHYRVFFRGWSGLQADLKIRDAEGDALFTPDGKVLECSQRGRRGDYLRDEPKLPTETREEFDERQRALYGMIEEMGRLYAKGTPVLDGDRARVGNFASEFWVLSGPGLAASHRALNPGFWAWVEMNGDASPAK